MTQHAKTYKDLWDFFYDLVARPILQKAQTLKANLIVDHVLARFVARCMSLCDSIIILHRTEADKTTDCCCLMRPLYDAFIQLAYIMHDPNKRTERAELYWAFSIVERDNMIKKIDANKTEFAKTIQTSPLRVKGEADHKRALAQVIAKYQTKNGKLRKYWYSGTLRDLAEEVGLVNEYDLMVAVINQPTHSSPFALRHGAPVPTSAVDVYPVTIMSRVLKMLVDHTGIDIDDEVTEALEDSNECPFKKQDGNLRLRRLLKRTGVVAAKQGLVVPRGIVIDPTQ